ncbi:hypothetical protein ACFW1F_30365 [Streptomyces bungoensis]|uniref:hypothetical protein n=1 Tax=Streptomyces bungoensis TaxID=285568 RepID=UPI00341AC820
MSGFQERGPVHQVVFRWDGNHGRQVTGMSAVAHSCPAEQAAELGRELGPLLWVSGPAAARPSVVRTLSRDGRHVMLVQRWPTTDRGGRPSTVSHVLVGHPQALKTRQCIALAHRGFSSRTKAEGASGQQREIDCAVLDELARPALPRMVDRLPDVKHALTLATAELLRDPRQRLSLLVEEEAPPAWPSPAAVPLVYYGLFMIFGNWLPHEWTFATYDTVDTHPLRLMSVPRWEQETGGPGPLARVMCRAPVQASFEQRAAARLVEHLLENPQARPGVPHLVDDLHDGAALAWEHRRALLQDIIDRRAARRRAAGRPGHRPDRDGDFGHGPAGAGSAPERDPGDDRTQHPAPAPERDRDRDLDWERAPDRDLEWERDPDREWERSPDQGPGPTVHLLRDRGGAAEQARGPARGQGQVQLQALAREPEPEQERAWATAGPEAGPAPSATPPAVPPAVPPGGPQAPPVPHTPSVVPPTAYGTAAPLAPVPDRGSPGAAPGAVPPARDPYALHRELREHRRTDGMRHASLTAELAGHSDETLLGELRSGELSPDALDLVLNELGRPARLQARRPEMRDALCAEVLSRSLYLLPGDPAAAHHTSQAAAAQRAARLFHWAVAPSARDQRYLHDLLELFEFMDRDRRPATGNWLRDVLVEPRDGQVPDLPPQVWSRILHNEMRRGGAPAVPPPPSGSPPHAARTAPFSQPEPPPPPEPPAGARRKPAFGARFGDLTSRPGCVVGSLLGLIGAVLVAIVVIAVV